MDFNVRLVWNIKHVVQLAQTVALTAQKIAALQHVLKVVIVPMELLITKENVLFELSAHAELTELSSLRDNPYLLVAWNAPAWEEL